MSILKGLSGVLAASLLTALLAPVTGCTQGGDDDLDGEEVSSASLASTFNCAGAFGAIGDAITLSGEILLPNGTSVPVSTVPSGASLIACAGGPVTVNWQPIKIKVPVGSGPTGKLVLSNFVVFGNPGATTVGECVTPTACYPDDDGDSCADDTDLLWFNNKSCTIAAFKDGTCGLSAASANLCGTL